MTIDDQIRDEKLQLSAWSSGKIDKYVYLTSEEILPSHQKHIIEQAKFTYSSLGKNLEKRIKTIEDQGERQIKANQSQGEIKKIKRYPDRDKDNAFRLFMLYKPRNNVTEFFDDYSSMLSKAKLKATKSTRLRILTSKQMLQRLPIALGQVKAGNNSEKLLNEIKQIVYSLYQSKQITKKVYHNINKLIQL